MMVSYNEAAVLLRQPLAITRSDQCMVHFGIPFSYYVGIFHSPDVLGAYRIKAGCRWLTREQAIAHWEFVLATVNEPAFDGSENIRRIRARGMLALIPAFDEAARRRQWVYVPRPKPKPTPYRGNRTARSRLPAVKKPRKKALSLNEASASKKRIVVR